MNTRLRLFTWFSILLVLSMALSACGADQSSNFSPPSSPTSTTGTSVNQLLLQPTAAAMRAEQQATASGAIAIPATGGAAPAQRQAASAREAPYADQPRPVEPKATPVPQQPIEANPFVNTSEDHLSTFALDVDTGSYTAMRNYVNAGQRPPAHTVRVEEFVNYFNYNYPSPQTEAFGIYVDSAPSPYGAASTQIVRVGIQGKRIDSSQRNDAVLTFVIDVSGSMQEPNRLPLVKESLDLLLNELRETDRVGIVVYGSQARVLLEHTGASERERIMQAIDSLADEGSTNAEAGLRLGYEQASKHFKVGGINRVILCSDGVANVGETGPEGIRQSIREYASQGVYLTTVGFGMGDYNDYLMEQLADDGNGNYAYVDTLSAARRIFVENLTGTLQVVAKDVKLQVDFNPAVVKRYRLLGYENRNVADADFRNDKVDAGEVGAGHSVTALYEVELLDQGSGPALTVQLRYADPKTSEVSEIQQPFERNSFGKDFAAAAPHFQLAVAVAGFAERLRATNDNPNLSYESIIQIAQRVAPQLPNDQDTQEFVQIVQRAQQLR